MEFICGRLRKTLVVCLVTIVSAAGFTACSTSSPSWRQYSKQGEQAALNDDWVAAERYYAAALEQAERSGPVSYRVSRSLDRLANAKVALRKYPEAEALCRRRLDVDEKRGLTNNTYFVEALVSLAQVQAYQKQFDEAEQLHLRAQSIIEFKYNYTTPVLGLLIAKRAAMYDMAGRFSDSEACYAISKSKLDTLERGLPGSPERDWVLTQAGFLCNDYGLLKEHMKKYPEAEALFLESLGRLEIQIGKNSPRIVTVLNNLARVYAKQNNYDLAEATIRRSMGIVERSMPAGNPTAADTRALMTAILARQVNDQK